MAIDGGTTEDAEGGYGLRISPGRV